MNELILAAQAREKTGVGGHINSMREKGDIPAVVYGEGKPPMHISVPEKEILKIIRTAKNSVIKLKYSKDDDNVVIKAVQKHVVTDRLLHIDFKRISLSKKIEVQVHIKIVGEAYGVKTQGGLFHHGLRSVDVSCLPTDIPKEIVIDISSLRMGESIRTKDIKCDKGEIIGDMEQIVVSVTVPREEATPEESAAAAEPEVAEKGKKEEGDAKAEEKKK